MQKEFGLNRISGPVSWVGYKIGDVEMHFFGDVHKSHVGECENCEEDECLTIDQLFKNIMIASKENKVSCDVFIEDYMRAPDFEEPELAKDEGVLIDVRQMLNEFQKAKKQSSPNPYVDIHYVDIRQFNVTKYGEPFYVLYMFLYMLKPVWENAILDLLNVTIPGNEEGKSKEEITSEISDVTKEKDILKQTIYWILEDIVNIVPMLSEYINSPDGKSVIEKVIAKLTEYKSIPKKSDVEFYKTYIDDIIEMMEDTLEITTNKASLYYDKLYKLWEKYPDIANHIDKYVKNSIGSYFLLLKEYFQNVKKIEGDLPKDQDLVDILEYITRNFLAYSCVIMDGYTLGDILLNMKLNQKQIILYIAGEFHRENIVNFLNLYRKSEPNIELIGSITPNTKENYAKKENIIRCLESENFQQIFGPWMKMKPKSGRFGIKLTEF